MDKAKRTTPNSKPKKSQQNEDNGDPSKRSFNNTIDKVKIKRKCFPFGAKSQQCEQDNDNPFPVPKIWDDELAELEITEEKLKSTRLDKKVTKSRSRRRRKYKNVCVKKPVNTNGTKMMAYAVMRPANYDDPVKPIDITQHRGPTFDNGKIVPHSILGTVKEFTQQAQNRGDYTFLYETQHAEKKSSFKDGVLESSSMRTWRYQNKDWQTLAKYLSESVSRPVQHLLMYTPGNYSLVHSDRNMVSTLLDAQRRGYGEDRHFRAFWRQQKRMGDDIGGLHATLKRSDRGFLNDIEMVDMNLKKVHKKGLNSSERQHNFYPAFYTPYLDEQRENVKDIMDRIIPHKPLFEVLNIIGTQVGDDQTKVTTGQTNDAPERELSPLTKINTSSPNINDTEIIQSQSSNVSNISSVDLHVENVYSKGPEIIVCGKQAKWEGNEDHCKGQQKVITSVLFESMIDERVTGHIEIINTGSTAIYYDWKKEVKLQSFDIYRSKIQRFYFFEEGGAIAPEGQVRIPVIFKSPTCGIFCEHWKLITRPVLCSGGDIIVIFKGVTKAPQIPAEEFDLIEKKFLHHQARTIVVKILDDLVRSVNPRVLLRPLTTDHYPKKSFNKEYRKMFYHSSSLKSLEQLYTTIQQSENLEQCNFSLPNLRKAIQNLDPDKQTTEEYVSQFVAMTTNLCFHWPEPVNDLKFKHYQTCYEILQLSVDNFVRLASHCADMLNLPMIQPQQPTESLEVDDEKPVKDKRKQSQQAATSNTHKKNPKGKKGGDSLKGQNQLKAPGPQSGRTTPSTSASMRFTTPGVPELSKSPSIERFSTVDYTKITKSSRNKYREHMYMQVYNILNSAVLQFVSLIEN